MDARRVPGGCLCGAVRFDIELPALFCAHCHCSMCRRAHGAGYVTWTAAPYERFRVVAGADRLVRYRSSEHGTRTFCGTCGSTLFCESTNHPAWIDIVVANLDGDVGLAPQAHFYFDDRASWTRVADELPRFGGTTGVEPQS
ncbi:MAG TPA: GFA family protein [Candidatus Binatus sp.]|nr:GFA family protein [Candidatus Binatus sp.]